MKSKLSIGLQEEPFSTGSFFSDIEMFQICSQIMWEIMWATTYQMKINHN